jgi:hypothetical protein
MAGPRLQAVAMAFLAISIHVPHGENLAYSKF